MSDRFNRYIDYWTNPELDKKDRIDRPSVPEQMDIINRDGATVVSAGAGSGKTTVLSLRFLRLILDEKAKVDEILTLTFTKKAAREMYERIHEHLKKAEKIFPEIITDQMKYFASASISTIDSFCSEIARTAPEKYGITRDFELLTNQEYSKMVKHVTENLFKENQDLMTRLSRYIDPKSIGTKLFAKLAKNLTIMSDSEKLFDVDKWFELKSFLTTYLISQLKDTIQSWDDWYYQHKDEISQAGSLLFPKDEKLCIIPELQRILATESTPWLKLAEQKFGKQSDNLKAYKHDIDIFKFRCHLLDTLNREDEAFWKSLMTLFADFAEELKTEKKKAGLLSYSDTEALAITILKENKAVRDWYRNKFKYIMIDEFQDNSASQKELIYLIAGKKGNDLSGMDAEKLFFVGDAKQSIYRFRGADVSVFNRLSEDLKQVGCESLPLNTNYRSEPTLVQHFNNVFRHVFHEEDIDDTPDTKAMWLKSMQMENVDFTEANLHDHEAVFEETKQRKAKEGINSRIVLSKLDTTDIEEPNKLKAADCRAREAKRIIELIRDMTETDNWLIPEKDKSKGTLTRRPTVNDIAILLRKTSLQNTLEPMLAREGIKYTVYGSKSVANEALANDFTAYLKLLEYRKDKMAFLSILRSPFVAMSDNGIHTIRAAFKKTELSKTAFSLELLPDDISADDKLRYETSARFYGEMLESSRTSTPAALVEKLYYEGGYYAYLEADPERRIYEEHFEYIWEEANKCTDIFSFLDKMKALMDADNHEDQIDTDLLRFDNDGVKIMTIHKSKGLAFPIVIIGDIYNDKKMDDSDYVFESPSKKSLYFHNKLITDTDKDIYLKDLVEAQNRICENAEARRLLYVAMTRSQYHLVATGSLRKIPTSNTDAKYEKVKYLSIGEIYEDALSELKSEGVKMPGFKELPYTWEMEEDTAIDRQETSTPNAEFYEKKTVTLPEYKAMKKGVKEVGLEISEPVVRNSSNKLPEFSPEVDEILKVKDRSASFGTLCHAMLEAKILKNPKLPEYDNWNILPSEKKVLEAEAEAIADKFLASDFYKEITEGIKPSDIHPEYEFYTIYNDGEEPIALEGSIDLFIEGSDTNIVIDYKTDTFKDPNIHKGQLSLYAKAMTEITGKATKAYVVYLRNMEAVVIPIR